MVSSSRYKENIDLIELDGKKIYLVGTAHISHQSAELVAETIKEIAPHTVAVELCEPRFRSLQNPDRWKNTDILTVLREGRAYVLLSQLVLAGFQKKLGGKLKITPGAEMLKAIECANEINAQIILADREVKTTLKRTWASLGLLSMGKLIISMVVGTVGNVTIDEKEIERLKTADALEELMREFTEKFPDVRRTLIDERDIYLAMKIKEATGPTVVAVVGAGHVPGILKWIDKSVDLGPLDIIPPPSLLRRALSWSIPTLVVGMIIYGFLTLGVDAGASMLSKWFIINACFGALGAVLALAHPLSILSAAIVGPFTALHPGWIAGIVEALIRKPRVADLEMIGEDILSPKGWWRNRVTRILLVMALTNLSGLIGGIVGAWFIAKALS